MEPIYLWKKEKKLIRSYKQADKMQKEKRNRKMNEREWWFIVLDRGRSGGEGGKEIEREQATWKK